MRKFRLAFVGIGLAALIGIAYVLLVLLASIYAGVIVGSVIARRFFKRDEVLWRDGVIGMFVLSLLLLLPIAGPLVFALLAMFAAGALLLVFFRFAFAHEERA